MMLLGSSLRDTPVMSLQTGSELAKATAPVIDPKNLSVVAYDVSGPMLHAKRTLLRVADIRELSDIGMIVDSSDEFIEPGDVMKIDEICNEHFLLVGMPVRDEKRTKLGTVIDFTLDASSFIVQQLTVKRPLLKSLNDTELLIHRTQIIEINNEAIVVHSAAKAPEPERHEVLGSYVNPFRKSKPAAEPADVKSNED